MTPTDRDAIAHKLKEVFEFYNKKIDEVKLRVWFKSIGNMSVETFITCCDEYYTIGEYLPKPADIRKLAAAKGQYDRTHTGAAEADLGTPSSPEIASAWIAYNKRIHGWSFGEIKVNQTWEEVIEIVNREAFKFNMPESLQPEHRLDHVWESSF